MYGKDAINAAADEMIAKVNALRETYLKYADAEPEPFEKCDTEDAYVWLVEGLF